METQQLSIKNRQTGADDDCHAAHATDLVRAAIQRELESELRGLVMAARLHGFRLAICGDGMIPSASNTECPGQPEEGQHD